MGSSNSHSPSSSCKKRGNHPITTSHLKLEKERDTNRATNRETPNNTQTTNQPNQKSRQGSCLKMAETAEEAVRQGMNSTLALSASPSCPFMFSFMFLSSFFHVSPRGDFFARVGALRVPRGTSHRDEFVWGVRGMSLTNTTSRTKSKPKTKTTPTKQQPTNTEPKRSGSCPYKSKRAKGADPRTNTVVKRGDELITSRSQYRTSNVSPREKVFFPRARTPCGRSAQVIIEGKGNTT